MSGLTEIQIFVGLAFMLSCISLYLTLKQKQQMAKTFEDFKNEADEISGRIGKVAADVAGLKTKIKSLEDLLTNAGMSAEDEEKAFGLLRDIKTEVGIVDEETPDAETGGGTGEDETGG